VRRQLHEGGRLDDRHAAREEEVDVALLEQVVEGRVDQVDRERLAAQRGLDLVEPRRHLANRQPARAKGREHAALAGGDDEVGRRDALGHRARVERVLHAVVLHEGGRAQPERPERHRVHLHRAHARPLHHERLLRLEQRLAHRRRVGGGDRGDIGRALRRPRQRRRRRRRGEEVRGGRRDADAQPRRMVHAERVDVQVAVGGDGDGAVGLLHRLDVDLDVAAVGLGRELAAVLPRGLAEVVRKGRVGDARAEARVHAEELERLVHRLDAERARHHGVAPEVARKEPVARVDGLEAVAVPLTVLAARRREADLIEEANLVRPPAEQVGRREAGRDGAGEELALVGGEGEAGDGVLVGHVPALALDAVVEPDLLLEDRGQEPAEGRVDLVKGLAVHLEHGVELLDAHLAEHGVAGAL